MAPSFVYRIHGLNIHSEIELPVWPRGEGEPDAVIRWGDVPAELPNSRQIAGVFSGRTGICILNYREVGGPILIEGGRAITVAPAARGAMDYLHTLLSGAAVVALLYQRRALCLHASAVAFAGQAWLLMGLSGAGKSTLAAALVERGGTLLADDVTALDFAPDGSVRAHPGFRTFRLMPDALPSLPIHAARAATIDAKDTKYLVPAFGPSAPSSLPIGRICLLQRRAVIAPASLPIEGARRFFLLQKNLFRPRLGKVVGDPQALFAACAHAARHLDLRRIVRPETGFPLDQLCALITAPLAG